MQLPTQLFACASLAVCTAACATFGTNVAGDFTCRAPKGTCAPSRVIDAAATNSAAPGAAQTAGLRRAAFAGEPDTARTGERTLKVVFPAHVDEAGTLHDEAAAWTVVEAPRWAAELSQTDIKAGDDRSAPLMRQLRRQLRASQASSGAPPASADPALPFAPAAADPNPEFSDASPLVPPSTAREAVAGATAPAAEGFDMPAPPHVRTPRPMAAGVAPLEPSAYPSAAEIDAARAGRRLPEATLPAPAEPYPAKAPQ